MDTIGFALRVEEMETVTVSRWELERLKIDNMKLKAEIEMLRNTGLYRRLMECLENLKKKEYTRADVGI